MEVKQAVTVLRSPEEVYQFWRDFSNLPKFMSQIAAIQVMGERTSHWKTTGSEKTALEWDAEITDDQPGKLIAWRSLDGASVTMNGVIRLATASADRGTEVRLELQYSPPGGAVSEAIDKLFGADPESEASDDLRRFKQLIETGEITVSDASLQDDGPAQPGAHQQAKKSA